MQTETTDNPSVWEAPRARRTSLAHLFDLRLVLLLLLALLASVMAYQAPPQIRIAVGWFGDQLFLPSSQGLGGSEALAGRWYADEHNDTSPTHRSRWTRNRAIVELAGVRSQSNATLAITAQGWPTDAIRESDQPSQPTVNVQANGQSIGSFTATADWQTHHLTIPADILQADHLEIEFTSVTFIATQAFQNDVRPKGIRVAQIELNGASQQGFVLPPLAAPTQVLLIALLAFFSLNHVLRRATIAFVLSIVVISGIGLGLAIARLWLAPLLPWLVGLLLAVFGVLNWLAVARGLRLLYDRFAQGSALTIGLAVAMLGWLLYLLIASVGRMSFGLDWRTFTYGLPDAVLLASLAISLVILALLSGLRAIGRTTIGLVQVAASPRGALIVLGVFLAIWLGYETWMIAMLPGVGHADYSDNAVVARNLLAGRGWVVDYVTQFYHLYPNGSVTRPQETWPLLQPVWIVPFFALLGPTDLAARLPNVLFTGALGLLVYLVGARVWDRRVGVTAAIVLLTNYLFFLLAINVTSDLAFVVFSFAALASVYRWGQRLRNIADWAAESRWQRWRYPIVAGMFTGLMMLQKPANGVFAALGLGIWLLIQLWQNRPKPLVWRETVRRLMPVAAWTLVAMLILSPYLIRNMLLFRSLFYSTESRDAWITNYTDDWEYIYKVFTPEYGLSDTQGLPDRSWILRWGFDRTMQKIGQQVTATRDFLVPPWRNLPLGLSSVLSGTKDGPPSNDPNHSDARLLFGLGAWLSLLGLLLALRRRSALVGLLALAFGPYLLFLVLYWHIDEPRYLVALMPWLALLAAAAIWAVYDRFAGTGRLAPLGLLLALVLTVGVVSPSWPAIEQKIAEWHYADGDRDAYEWLKQNTPADAVVMTRVPWQLNWHSERPALMIPYTKDKSKFMQLARYYHVRYIAMDVGQRPDKDFVLNFLNPMLEKDGFILRYTSPDYGKDETLIYEFPADYGNVPELRP